jgi:hypothetical protein
MCTRCCARVAIVQKYTRKEATPSHMRHLYNAHTDLQLRLYRVWNVQMVIARFSSMNRTYIILLRNLLLVLSVAHVFACMFYFLTVYDFYSSYLTVTDEAALNDEDVAEADSWFGVTPAELRTWPASAKYVRSLYWSMTTLTTVGYGDFSAKTIPEQAFTVVRELVWQLASQCA